MFPSCNLTCAWTQRFRTKVHCRTNFHNHGQVVARVSCSCAMPLVIQAFSAMTIISWMQCPFNLNLQQLNHLAVEFYINWRWWSMFICCQSPPSSIINSDCGHFMVYLFHNSTFLWYTIPVFEDIWLCDMPFDIC